MGRVVLCLAIQNAKTHNSAKNMESVVHSAVDVSLGIRAIVDAGLNAGSLVNASLEMDGA